jgi:glycine C-acetyltransferase
MTSGPLDFLTDSLAKLEADGLVMDWPTLEAPQEPHTVLDGRPVINMAANNYLGLANHPAVKDAAAAALARYGAGVASARNACGNLPLHDELEARLAAFKGVEAVLVTQTGYVANVGIFPALLDEHDAIVSDALNHASLIDSARMSRAKVHVYAHGDVSDAEAKLNDAKASGARCIALVTDGIFSMDGDIAPLPGLVAAAEAAGAFAYVDDAHAVGVIGNGGRGTVDHFGLEGRVAIQVGTLSKALGIMGGYIAGSRDLIRWLEQRHRAQFFSASTLTPADTAASLKALDIVEAEPDRIERLWARAAYFREGLKSLGYDTGVSETPLIPVIIGDAAKTKSLRNALMEAGVFAVAVTYPIVAEDASRLRTIVSSEHTEADLDEVLDAFARCGKSVGAL